MTTALLRLGDACLSARAFARIVRAVSGMGQRRWGAAFALALFVCAGVVVPAFHLAGHAAPGVDAARIDVDALRDEAGRVDLARLAAELGRAAHDESRPHSHGPLPEGRHGEGSLEHFMLALATAPPVATAPVVTTFERLESPRLAPESATPALVFLSAQRAQAPPRRA